EHHSRKLLKHEVINTYICTVELARAMFPNLHNHKLQTIAKHLNVQLLNHHRACDDAEALAQIFMICVQNLQNENIHDLEGLNRMAATHIDIKHQRSNHGIILAKNQTGLRNLYELVSKAHIDYFHRSPRMPKSQILSHRDGLILGTACEAGELYAAVRQNRSQEEIENIAAFYDYFEIQPTGNNMFLIDNGEIKDIAGLQEINRRIYELGKQLGKPTVATCDVHFMDSQDEVYRRIIMAGQGFKDADNQAPLFFRTTEEMLEEFSYLGAEIAFEVVVDNTNLINDMIEDILPIPKGTFPPKIPGADEDLRDMTMERAKKIYGNPLPEFILTRINRELESIIKNGYAGMYIVAQKLVQKSLDNGYLVGSRGSVGSSFVATMAGITEVNPLSPHYHCINPDCYFTDFDSEHVLPFAGGSGCDMPDRNCPNCNSQLKKDGHDIPFETYLGFDGEKEPDIDLNFSGEYQAQAHIDCEELFGEGYVFRAGTIGTVAEKTAYGYVKKYLDERQHKVRGAEINRLVLGCTGIKRTTGQHPGGLVIVPNGKSIYEFTPVQRPANDSKSDIITTHFDYHSIEGRLSKLDILGHDVPTIIHMLHDATGIDPKDVNLGDKDIISLFNSPRKLGVTEQDINCKTGSLGLPEFGTGFVRQMLQETRPTTFAELARISGLSHGTDVWTNNGQELIKQGTATLKEIIPTRDDIMVYLINKGVAKSDAFKIMEKVRKGKGVSDEEEAIMQAANVPKWYIESCRKIKYMFPKGHAVAYVMMTMRIGYFKIHHPKAFYAASLSVKSDEVDYDIMCQGREKAAAEMRRINQSGQQLTQKDKSRISILELIDEMYARGINFTPLDLYVSHTNKFLITDDGIMPPLCTITGLGETNAKMIKAERGNKFYSIEDFKTRTKTTKTVIELLKQNGVLSGIPETDQMDLDSFGLF
ncbi:MAG: PolC-type DNA polymerase III, partial [Defluviitaleaceae bacterium]|nr:PolC-type DNA polymerase III [Defluviitaleaceae bacterium]